MRPARPIPLPTCRPPGQFSSSGRHKANFWTGPHVANVPRLIKSRMPTKRASSGQARPPDPGCGRAGPIGGERETNNQSGTHPGGRGEHGDAALTAASPASATYKSQRCQASGVADVTAKIFVQRLRGMSRASAANHAWTATPSIRHISRQTILSSTRPASHHRIKPAGGSASQPLDRVSGRHSTEIEVHVTGVAAGSRRQFWVTGPLAARLPPGTPGACWPVASLTLGQLRACVCAPTVHAAPMKADARDGARATHRAYSPSLPGQASRQ